MKKKIVCWLLLCLFVFWGCRIYSINQCSDNTEYYDMEDVIDYDFMSVQPIESHLYTVEEFYERFGIMSEETMGEKYLLCVSLRVRNLSEEKISWDTVMEHTNCGFETTTWASAIATNETMALNVFYTDALEVNGTQDIWYVTGVNEICFKSKNWECIKEYPFSYVLTLYPEKIKIRLKIEEGVI